MWKVLAEKDLGLENQKNLNIEQMKLMTMYITRSCLSSLNLKVSCKKITTKNCKITEQAY